MPGKSRRQKEKKLFKQGAVSGQPASIVTPVVNVTVNETPPIKSFPTPAPVAAKGTVVASPFVKRELLTITLVTGVMLVVVIVLSIVLR
jgi:hypothetical protein